MKYKSYKSFIYNDIFYHKIKHNYEVCQKILKTNRKIGILAKSWTSTKWFQISIKILMSGLNMILFYFFGLSPSIIV